MGEFTEEIRQDLLAPFPEIEWKPGSVSGNQARAMAFIDARAVMNRLDAVVGPAGWSFDFDPLSVDGKMVRGRLTVLGVTKCDAGQANAEDEPLKSAVSDALKRAAVHFGVGRYLHLLPAAWGPYDTQKRRFTAEPRLDPKAVADALEACGYKQARQPESRGDQGAQRARAAVQAQEQPAASLMEGQALDALPEDDPQREEIRFLVDRCERANVSDARTLGGALSWSNRPDLTAKKAATILNTLKAALPAEPPPSVSPGEVPAAFR